MKGKCCAMRRQELDNLFVASLHGIRGRCLPVFILRVDLGVVVDQQLHQIRMTPPGGIVQGRDAGRVLRVDVRARESSNWAISFVRV